jgi:O-antigen/teichoic acid export membrane protein
MTNDQHSIRGKVFRGVGWAYLSTFLKALSQLVFITILSRLLTPRDFGLLGLALIFTNLAERIGQFGITPALIQKGDLQEEDWRVARPLAWGIGGSVAVLLFFLSAPISLYFEEPELRGILQVLSVLFVFEGLCIVYEGWLTRQLEFKALTFVDNLAYFTGYCVIAVPLALLDYGVWALVAGQISIRISKLLLYRVALFRLKTSIPEGLSWNTKRAFDLLRLGVGFSLGRLLNFAALQGDNFIVGRMLGTSRLGLYTRVYQLMTIPSVYVAQVLDKVLFPALALKQREKSTLKRGFLTLVEVVSLLSLPLSAICFVLPEVVISVVLGSQWLEAAPVLRIFGIGIFFRSGYKAGDTVVRSLGLVYRYSTLQAIYATCVLGGAYLGSHYGLYGVAIAVLTAVAVNYFTLSFLAQKEVGATFSEFLQAHLSGLWVATAVGAGCLLLEWWRRTYEISPYLVFLCAIPVVLSSGVGALLFAPSPFFPKAIKTLAEKGGSSRLFKRIPKRCLRLLRIEESP